MFKPEGASLNSRSKLFANFRHRKKLIQKQQQNTQSTMLLERLQLPSTGPKYFLADPFVRHQAKEIKIGLENNSMGKV